MTKEEDFDDLFDVELDDIEGKDPARADFIRGFIKAAI